MLPFSSKLCRTGQADSKARKELSENLTSARLNCLRTGKWSPLALFPSVKPQPPKLTARSVDEKRCTDAGGGGSGSANFDKRGRP